MKSFRLKHKTDISAIQFFKKNPPLDYVKKAWSDGDSIITRKKDMEKGKTYSEVYVPRVSGGSSFVLKDGDWICIDPNNGWLSIKDNYSFCLDYEEVK